MSDLAGTLNGATDISTIQENIDGQVTSLSAVLELNDHFAVLDWISEYASTASRISDPGSVNLRSGDIVRQMEDYGYTSEYEEDSDTPEAHAIKFISSTLERIKSGKALIGFEGIFVDRIKSELGIPDQSGGLV